MTDVERRLRDLLEHDARHAPPPHAVEPTVRRTRRRQLATVVSATVVTLGIAALAAIALGALIDRDPSVPGDRPTVTNSLNGISITYPQSWELIDPDEAGLNGPGPATLPRIVLALAPTDPGDALGCPGLAEGSAPTFLMTVQETPLALAGEAASPWPVELAPLGVDASESACYPGWEFLTGVWTAQERTFDARIGLSPDMTAEDREALLVAFASMTFEAASDGVASVVLATGTAGGEGWQLIATRQADGLSLSLDAESVGTGTGGYDPTPDELLLTTLVIGDDERAVRMVFGAVPAAAVRIELEVSGEGPDPGPAPEILDVPDEIDPLLDAFVLAIGEGQIAKVEAYDDAGSLIATGETRLNDPVETGLPVQPDDVQAEQGGTYWAVYLTVAASIDDLDDRAFQRAKDLGYTPWVGDIACDEEAAEELDVDPEASRVAVYFRTNADASAFFELSDPPPVGVAKVRTYCLDRRR